jgi:hypothetical protein
MTKKEFLASVAGMNRDVLGQLLAMLEEMHTAYCEIGGPLLSMPMWIPWSVLTWIW